jgi:type I restriction enzyme S subunit
MAVPKLRFKEFGGDLTESKLVGSTSWASGGTPAKDIPEYWGDDIPLISGASMHTNQLYESDVKITKLGLQKGSKLAPKDSILILVRGSMLFNKIPMGITLGDVAFNQDVKCIRPKQGLVPLFLFQWLHAKENIIQNKVTATGIGAGKLDTADLQNLKLYKSSVEEQTKIASFLSAVDEKISQLTQKHQLLSQYKQGMMQKLFSQQIRFKADDGSEFGEWEDKTISEIASYRRGSFPQPYGLPEWLDENGFPFVQVYDVAENMLLKDKTKIKISQLAANQSVLAKAGTLIITLQGSIGRVAKMQYDAYVDRTLLIFQSYAMPIDTDYFKYALYLLFNIEKEKADGGIIKTITKETLSKFNIGIPCLEEQTKIANFLSAIDQKIEVVTQQIEQAKTWKKGLLQQMFV